MMLAEAHNAENLKEEAVKVICKNLNMNQLMETQNWSKLNVY